MTINAAGTSSYLCGKKVKLNFCLIPYAKINYRLITDIIGESKPNTCRTETESQMYGFSYVTKVALQTAREWSIEHRMSGQLGSHWVGSLLTMHKISFQIDHRLKCEK